MILSSFIARCMCMVTSITVQKHHIIYSVVAATQYQVVKVFFVYSRFNSHEIHMHICKMGWILIINENSRHFALATIATDLFWEPMTKLLYPYGTEILASTSQEYLMLLKLSCHIYRPSLLVP